MSDSNKPLPSLPTPAEIAGLPPPALTPPERPAAKTVATKAAPTVAVTTPAVVTAQTTPSIVVKAPEERWVRVKISSMMIRKLGAKGLCRSTEVSPEGLYISTEVPESMVAGLSVPVKPKMKAPAKKPSPVTVPSPLEVALGLRSKKK